MLRIYTDRQYLPPNSRPLHILFPFWGVGGKRHETRAVFEKYMRQAPEYFSLTSDIQSADMVLLPGSWPRYTGRHFLDKAQELVDRAADAGKPVIAFTTTDRERELTFKGYHFRPSNLKSTMSSMTFSSPAWTRDILSDFPGGEVVIRPWQEKPVVGFCGSVNWGLPKFFALLKRGLWRLRLGRNPVVEDMSVYLWPAQMRNQVLALVPESTLVTTNFILTKRIRRSSEEGEARPDALIAVAKERFARNMMDSDYVLCMRGHGNYSFRFYETLSAGRIPVFVNTDCALPYDWYLKWKDYCVWVEQEEIPNIGEKIAEFHARLSPSDFVEMQHACRRLWDEWVSPEGFFRNFHRHLEREGVI